MVKYTLKVIETEQEYKEQLKIYKRRIGKLFKTAFRHLAEPEVFFNKFDNTLDEMVFIKLVTPEFAQSERMRLYNELNRPAEFRSWIDDSISKVKNKFKGKKNNEIKEQHNKIKKIIKEHK